MSFSQYFGRAWKITVTPQQAGLEEWTVANSEWGKESLRCTFVIEQAANSAYWSADISIFNLDPDSAQKISKDDEVTVEAGYLSPGSGLIFKGKVWQPLWERVECDNKLTLHCLLGLFEDETGIISTTIAAGATQADAVNQVATAAGLTVEALDQALTIKKYPRGFAYQGPARWFFDQIARANDLTMWIGWTGVNIRSLGSDAEYPDLVYAPPFAPTAGTGSSSGVTKYTLIGSPQQTEAGLCFRTLLDSDLTLHALVKVNASVKRLPQMPGQLQQPFIKDGLYCVAGILHTGDTHSNEWYTEVTAVSRDWDKLNATLYSR